MTNMNKRGRDNDYFAILKNVIAESVLLSKKAEREPKTLLVLQSLALDANIEFDLPCWYSSIIF